MGSFPHSPFTRWGSRRRLTPAEFTSAVLAAGGSELKEFYLAHDSATYCTIGTGVATWIGQKGYVNLTQATGSAQPAINATSGPNGRGRLNFTAASSQNLLASAAFSAVSGERWGLIAVVQPKATGAVDQRHVTFGVTGTAVLILRRTTASGWQSFAYNADGWSVGADNNTNPRVHEVWAGNPHVGVLDGVSANGAQTVGQPLTEGVNLCVGASRTGVGAFFDGYVMCVGVVKMAGTSVPAWVPSVRALIRTYYAEPGL